MATAQWPARHYPSSCWRGCKLPKLACFYMRSVHTFCPHFSYVQLWPSYLCYLLTFWVEWGAWLCHYCMIYTTLTFLNLLHIISPSFLFPTIPTILTKFPNFPTMFGGAEQSQHSGAVFRPPPRYNPSRALLLPGQDPRNARGLSQAAVFLCSVSLQTAEAGTEGIKLAAGKACGSPNILQKKQKQQFWHAVSNKQWVLSAGLEEMVILRVWMMKW